MKLPDRCPACGKELDIRGEGKPVYLFQRGEPDFDRSDPHRIVDSIEECSECHALFRLRWQLLSIHMLVEEEIKAHTEGAED